MNYLKIYNSIIERRKYEIPQGYSENHHIIPRSLGGSDKKYNLIRLTAREHFICHLLLTKIYPKFSINWYKVIYAFMMMHCSSKNQMRYTSKIYSLYKEYYSKIRSIHSIGSRNNHYGRIWIHNDILKKSKSVSKDLLLSYLQDGWEIGYVVNWDSYIRKKEYKSQRQILKNKKIEDNIKLYTEYYKIYDKYGWKRFKEITGFNKTNAFLVMMCNKYVKEFVPQNGKKRGKIDL